MALGRLLLGLAEILTECEGFTVSAQLIVILSTAALIHALKSIIHL
jgi:hypothetical protein